MTLKELSAQYKAAALPIRERLRELREKLSQTDDPEVAWHLRRRIAELSPMLTQMNDLAWMLDHYYERGGAVRDDRYGFNGIRRVRPKEASKGNYGKNHSRTADGTPAPDLPSLSLSGPEYIPACIHARRKQKYRKSYFETCGEENLSYHEVSVNLDDSLIDLFFQERKEKNNDW